MFAIGDTSKIIELPLKDKKKRLFQRWTSSNDIRNVVDYRTQSPKKRKFSDFAEDEKHQRIKRIKYGSTQQRKLETSQSCMENVYESANIGNNVLSKWQCTVCTVLNHPEVQWCEVCEQPRAQNQQLMENQYKSDSTNSCMPIIRESASSSSYHNRLNDINWNNLSFEPEEIPSLSDKGAWLHIRNPKKQKVGQTGKWLIFKDNVRLLSDISAETLKNYKLSEDPDATWQCTNCGCFCPLLEAFCTHCYTQWRHPHGMFTALDKAWMQTVVHTVNGTMNNFSAKCSTRGGNLLCIYTKDIFDELDVLKTAQDIKKHFGVRKDILYKSDMQTMLGIYSNGNAPPAIAYPFDEFWNEKRHKFGHSEDESFGLLRIPRAMYRHTIDEPDQLQKQLNENQLNYFKNLAKEREEYLKQKKKPMTLDKLLKFLYLLNIQKGRSIAKIMFHSISIQLPSSPLPVGPTQSILIHQIKRIIIVL